MSKIYVFANGEKYISVGGKCYIKTEGSGPVDTDSSLVTTHDTLESCTTGSSSTSTSSNTTSSTTTGSELQITPGSLLLTSTFYRVNLNDLTADEQNAIIEAQQESVQSSIASVDATGYQIETVAQSGSIKVISKVDPKGYAYEQIKQLLHEAASKDVTDVTGMLFKMSKKLTYKLNLLGADASLIDDVVDNIQPPDIQFEPPASTGANMDDHETWTCDNNQLASIRRVTLNIPISAEPRAFSRYLSYQSECYRLVNRETFDSVYDIHTGDLYASDQCELTWPELNDTNNGANWELSVYYGYVERGWYLAEWYSSISMSSGAGFNKQICIPRDRVIGIRYPSEHTLKIATASANLSGYIDADLTAREFKQQVVDPGYVTLTDLPIQSYPAKDETNVAGTVVSNKLIVFGGDYHLSNAYPDDDWLVYYSDSHPEMIGWLRVIDKSEDCKDTA